MESKKEWQSFWMNEMHLHLNRAIGSDNWIYHLAPEWFRGRLIKVYKELSIEDAIVEESIFGINEIIEEIGIDIEVEYCGVDEKILEQAEAATSQGVLSFYGLAKPLVTLNAAKIRLGERTNANILFTDRPINDGKNIDRLHGWSVFEYSYAVISYPGFINSPDLSNYSDSSLVRSLAKHEASHLMGFMDHHTDGYGRDVKGYRANDECTMHPFLDKPRSLTCDRCLDGLVYFWKGIENRTGESFFLNNQ